LYEILIEVDLGDGKPIDLGHGLDPSGAPENEYISSKRFIDEQYELLNNNFLEEIARKIRDRRDPLLQTVANLRAAMADTAAPG